MDHRPLTHEPCFVPKLSLSRVPIFNFFLCKFTYDCSISKDTCLMHLNVTFINYVNLLGRLNCGRNSSSVIITAYFFVSQNFTFGLGKNNKVNEI